MITMFLHDQAKKDKRINPLNSFIVYSLSHKSLSMLLSSFYSNELTVELEFNVVVLMTLGL